MTDALVISAEQAAIRGMKLYFTGVPCKHGHVGPRRVSDRNCCECKRRNVPIEPRGPHQRELLGRDLREPERGGGWPDNGRVEVVVDPNWIIDGKPRVVRKVGWRSCFCCKRRFFSADMHKVRICDACKDVQTDMSCGVRKIHPPVRRRRRTIHLGQDPSGPVAGESVRPSNNPGKSAAPVPGGCEPSFPLV